MPNPMLDLERTVDFFDRHYNRSAFRLETRDSYDVGSDGGDVTRYLHGEPAPDASRKNPWLKELAAERLAGKRRSRVHVLTTPLSDYLRYECEWGYAFNVEAGEEIGILDLATMPRPAALVDEDFWLLDSEFALRMVYDDVGRFVGALVADDPQPYRAAQEAAVAAAVDFEAWWQQHPEFWRVHTLRDQDKRSVDDRGDR